MGSAPLVASAAQTRNPKRQALVSMTGTFWDTVIICLMTGLVLTTSIIKHPAIDGLSGNGSELTSKAFSMIPYIGLPILIVGLITFAFSTILGWYYYGERCAVYLFGEKIILPYKILWVIGVFVGSMVELNLIWDLADLMNGLMAIPNIIAVLLLSGVKVLAKLDEVTEDGITISYEEKQAVEGKKRKVLVEVSRTYSFDEIKYTKEYLDFK
jgi:AGCS family alanine or glycine:cation symporter